MVQRQSPLFCILPPHMLDQIAENGSDVHVVGDLPFSRSTSSPARWVLVVPEDSPIRSVMDLGGKRIATEAVGLTKSYLAQHGVEAALPQRPDEDLVGGQAQLRTSLQKLGNHQSAKVVIVYFIIEYSCTIK